ncbi:MAG: hypothetical protein QM831_31855 [Kofleriaceae bacterium]
MTTPKPEVALETMARRLEGRVLTGVVYQGSPTLGDVHVATHAVFLEAGERIEVVAEDQVGIGHGVGVWLRPRKVIDPAFGAIMPAGDTEMWQRFVGTPVTRATINWADIYESLRGSLSITIAIHADHLRRIDYPASLELEFPEGGISITAGRFDAGKLHPLEPGLVIRAYARTR